MFTQTWKVVGFINDVSFDEFLQRKSFDKNSHKNFSSSNNCQNF